jgi:hypothetical protein
MSAEDNNEYENKNLMARLATLEQFAHIVLEKQQATEAQNLAVEKQQQANSELLIRIATSMGLLKSEELDDSHDANLSSIYVSSIHTPTRNRENNEPFSGLTNNPYFSNTPKVAIPTNAVIPKTETSMQQEYIRSLLENVQKFSGSETDRNPRVIQEWIASIAQATELFQLSGENACAYARSKLTNMASRWCAKTTNHDGPFKSLADFFERFHKEFFPREAETMYRDKLREFKQGRKESVTDAAIRFNEIS